MTESEFFDKFGKTLIASVRDTSLQFLRRKLAEELPFSEFEVFLGDLNDEQRDKLLQFAAYIIDGCLHDFMLMIENEKWIELRITDIDGDLPSILLRDIDVDLQGYALKWVKQFSIETRSSLTTD